MNQKIKPFVIYKDIETKREIALFDINHIDHFINNIHLKRVKANVDISETNWSFYKGHIMIVVNESQYLQQKRVLKHKGKNVETLQNNYRKLQQEYYKATKEQDELCRLVALVTNQDDLPF